MQGYAGRTITGILPAGAYHVRFTDKGGCRMKQNILSCGSPSACVPVNGQEQVILSLHLIHIHALHKYVQPYQSPVSVFLR